MRLEWVLVLSLAVVIFLGFWLIYADAEEQSCYGIYCDNEDDSDEIEAYKNALREKNFISIRNSKVCEITNVCPSYKDLADLFDNSNRYLSGDFIFDNETGKWKREAPIGYNVFEHYKFMNMPWVVFVDPDDYTWGKTKQIMIESQLRYHDSRDIIENNVRIEYEGLKVDGCKTATIGWKNNGETILLDLLNHFYSKCKQKMEFDPTIEIFINSTIFPDCDRECFLNKDQHQKSLRVDYILATELWEEKYCDEDDDDYNELDEDNKIECNRINNIIGDVKTEQECYGIYCDRDDDDDETFADRRINRIKELEDIEKCKREQIWDDVKIKGTWRFNLYDCDDEDEREDYLDIIKCLDYYEDVEDVDCYDESERDDFLELKNIEEVTGVPSNATETIKDEKEVKCYGIHCD